MDKDIYRLVESYMKDADEYSSDIQGLENYSEKEIKDIVRYFCDEVLDDESDIDIQYVFLCGSRVRGTAREDSDLDVQLFYSGNIKEDALFNILNDGDEKLVIDGVVVDINPKRLESDDWQMEIQKHIDASEKYDIEILNGEKI